MWKSGGVKVVNVGSPVSVKVRQYVDVVISFSETGVATSGEVVVYVLTGNAPSDSVIVLVYSQVVGGNVVSENVS